MALGGGQPPVLGAREKTVQPLCQRLHEAFHTETNTRSWGSVRPLQGVRPSASWRLVWLDSAAAGRAHRSLKGRCGGIAPAGLLPRLQHGGAWGGGVGVFCCSSHKQERTPCQSETAERELRDVKPEGTLGSKLESEKRNSRLLTKSTAERITSASSWTLSGPLFN